MRIHFMGTAAAEAWPAVFCRCDACVRARAAGGKNVRTRSGALIDGIYKFDWPADAYLQGLRDGLDLSAVRHVIFTHTHGDHFYPAEFGMHKPPFAHNTERLEVWGDPWAIEALRPHAAAANIGLHRLEPGDRVQIGEADVSVLRAVHYPERICHNYLFRLGGKTLFYGQDCGPFPEAHWQALAGEKLDVAVLDCTGGPISAGAHHGNIDTVVQIAGRLREMGSLKAGARLFANHFSHNGGLLHDELEAAFAPHGIEVTYDGLAVEI